MSTGSAQEEMKTLAIVVEPAEYTLALIEKIYRPRNIAVAFLKGASAASSVQLSNDTALLESLGFVARCRYLWSALKTFDVFILNDYTKFTYLLFIGLNLLFFRKPFALESDTELRVPANVAKRFLKGAWLRFLFTRPCCYGMPGGHFEHEHLFTCFGMPRNHVFLAPMQVDNDRFSRVCGMTADIHAFRFGYLGRVIEHKQVRQVLSAFSGLEHAEFHVIGDGDLRSKLEAAYKGYVQVIFEGAKFGDEKIAALHTLDCLVLYSAYEPWGLVVNEALASGIPVIVSDRVGCRHELVEPVDGMGATGLVVPWDDVYALRDAMRKMATNRAMHQTMAENALARMRHWNFGFYGRCLDKFLKEVGK